MEHEKTTKECIDELNHHLYEIFRPAIEIIENKIIPFIQKFITPKK